jgi:hypothetical protein
VERPVDVDAFGHGPLPGAASSFAEAPRSGT